MTSHVGRLYAAAVAIVVFFFAWLAVATKPWLPPPSNPRLAALTAREERLRAESIAAQRIVDERWAAYRLELARLRTQNARVPAVSPPAVRIVTLPPVTTTRSS
jgi:hypothetical protein